MILSGSMFTWGKEWKTAFDLAIFIRLENNETAKKNVKSIAIEINYLKTKKHDKIQRSI